MSLPIKNQLYPQSNPTKQAIEVWFPCKIVGNNSKLHFLNQSQVEISGSYKLSDLILGTRLTYKWIDQIKWQIKKCKFLVNYEN